MLNVRKRLTLRTCSSKVEKPAAKRRRLDWSRVPMEVQRRFPLRGNNRSLDYRNAATTGPRPISWASPCADLICSWSSEATRGRAATASRWIAALLSTTVTTRLLMRRTRLVDSVCVCCLRARSRNAASTGAQWCSCAGVNFSTLLMRAMLIEADECAPLTSIACARGIFGNKPVIASANTPAQRRFFIPMSPQQFEWVMRRQIPTNFAVKANEMRTKCGFVPLHGTKCGRVNAAAVLCGRGVHNMWLYVSADIGRMDSALDRGRFAMLADQLVQRTEIGLRGGNQCVEIGTLGGKRSTVFRKSDRHLRLRIGAACHGMHLVELERRLMRHERPDRPEDGVHRTVAGRLGGDVLAIDVERQRRGLWTHRAGDHRERQHLDAVVGVSDFLIDQRFDILVVDLLLAVSQRLEADESIFELIAGEFVAQLLQIVDESMASRM